MTIVLPDEVVLQIFSYLDARSLGNALQVSTTFYRIATAPSLWELPYLLRWSTGDAQREAARGTQDWRRNKKLKHLQEHARRSVAEEHLPIAPSPKSPFRYLQLVPPQSATEAHPKLDFYRLFLERIHIDQQVLDTLYRQVEATHDRIPTISSLAFRIGNDAKDVLTAIVEAQSSCPSSSSDGRAFTDTAAAASRRTGDHCRGIDPLAYDYGSYRLNAYQAHQPTTLRSETHHLVILHHAREMLEHLQRREAMQRMSELSQRATGTPPESSMPSGHRFVPSPTETAVSLLTMFRGGEATYVESQLDVLAAACDLYLQQRFSTTTESPEDKPTTLEDAKEMATSICDFLADHGFRGARDDLFSDLDNHFLHHCFTTNRETLPLSLTLIFCGIANRLGLRASLCNFPMRILAFVMADPEAPLPGPDDTLSSAPQALFWLDVCEYTTVAYDAHEPTATDAFARRASWLQQRPPILDRADLAEWTSRMGIPPSDDFWRPAQPDSMVQRAARNILTSVQRAQITPRNTHPVGQARSAIRNMEIGRRSARLELQWSQLVRVDHAFLSSFHGRTDPDEHEAISAHVSAALEYGETLAEDETTWRIVQTWRAESMRTLNMVPESWVQPALPSAARFRQWMHYRAHDNDWTRTRDNLYRRADSWSEHEQQAAKYAAVNAFLRLSTHVNAREVDWIAGFLQSYFMLDVEVIERDFLGVERREDEDEGSESSGDEEGEAFTIHAARNGKSATTGIVTNPSVRIILARMLQAVRAKDAEKPRVNRRVGSGSRRRLRHRAGAEPETANDQDDQLEAQEDLVGYRVGTIFRHRTYRYVGSILGWDPYCAAPEDWIVNMGVDRLPAPQSSSQPSTSPTSTTPPLPRRGGRHQPFYHSQVADGTRRYVAEVNVEPIHGPIWIYGTPQNHQPGDKEGEVVEEGRVLGTSLHKMLQLRGLGEYFRCFDQVGGRLRRNFDARTMFPDDWSDDDNDDDEEIEVEQEAADASLEEGVERLSEDGSW
ncbi:uncharacterized protein UTRI_01052 [Ustilago trichophora]|uniref:F-box domain-containing protein n=1 Tax=Ustilago trichophora TaxID=86804 RepID=A0A5C3DV62_9BASI|nr:uncharacterized protein UTRI_01052 [Ustilago trichophora]